MKEIDNEQGFIYWLKGADTGDKAIYYDGFLMKDRETFFQNGGTSENLPEPLKAANFAWHLYQQGLVRLIQKKKDLYSYEYIAVKS